MRSPRKCPASRTCRCTGRHGEADSQQDHVTSDYRLADLTTTTLGLTYGYALGDNSELSIRGEFMNQSVDDGDVPSGEETPDLDAIILNAGYSFRW